MNFISAPSKNGFLGEQHGEMLSSQISSNVFIIQTVKYRKFEKKENSSTPCATHVDISQTYPMTGPSSTSLSSSDLGQAA